MKFRFDNMDASENAFFSRQLESIRAQAFEVQYAPFLGMALVPPKTDDHPGCEQVTYRVYDKVGRAIISSDASDKGPRVDVKGFETTQLVRSLKDAYGYSMQEARNSMMANADLPVRKARVARLAIMTLMDDIILRGDAASGLQGLFTLSNTDTFTVPNGAAGLPIFTSKTPDEIVQDLHAMVFQVEQNTFTVEKCDTLVLPLERKGLVSTTRMGDGSNQTILSHFLETNGSINQVYFSQKLNSTAGSSWGASARAVAYKRDPDKLQAIIPVEFEQLAPQYDGYEVLTHCHARTGGTICYFPKSIIYATGI